MALIMIMAHTTGFFCIQIDGYSVELESFVMLMEIMQGGNLIKSGQPFPVKCFSLP